MKKAAIAALVIVLLCAAGYGLWRWTMHNGRRQAEQLAQENGFCSGFDCPGAANEMLALFSERLQVSEDTIIWCLGVDDWANTRVHRGGWVKSIALWAMYQPCDPLLEG